MLRTQAHHEGQQKMSAGEHRRTEVKIPTSADPVGCIYRVVRFTTSRQFVQEGWPGRLAYLHTAVPSDHRSALPSIESHASFSSIFFSGIH